MPSQLTACNTLRCIDFVTANRTAIGLQTFFWKIHQLQKRQTLGEKFNPSAVYTTPDTSRFLNLGIRRLKLPMNFLHRSSCAQNHFSRTESPHDAYLTWYCSMIRLSLPTTWACKHSLARNCHQRTAYVEYLYRWNSTCLGNITILSSYLCCFCKSKQLLYCAFPRKKNFIIKHCRRSVKFEHFLSCFVEAWPVKNVWIITETYSYI